MSRLALIFFVIILLVSCHKEKDTYSNLNQNERSGIYYGSLLPSLGEVEYEVDGTSFIRLFLANPYGIENYVYCIYKKSDGEKYYGYVKKECEKGTYVTAGFTELPKSECDSIFEKFMNFIPSDSKITKGDYPLWFIEVGNSKSENLYEVRHNTLENNPAIVEYFIDKLDDYFLKPNDMLNISCDSFYTSVVFNRTIR